MTCVIQLGASATSFPGQIRRHSEYEPPLRATLRSNFLCAILKHEWGAERFKLDNIHTSPINLQRNFRLASLTEVLVQRLGELVQRGGHLEPLVEDSALPLDAHILGPLHKPVQVLLGGQRATDAEALGALLKERVRRRSRSLEQQDRATSTCDLTVVLKTPTRELF